MRDSSNPPHKPPQPDESAARLRPVGRVEQDKSMEGREGDEKEREGRLAQAAPHLVVP
jgi:hypothetical protein